MITIFKRLILFTAILVNCFVAKALTVDTLIYNGNPANRINIVIMGDGYTAAQMPQFRSDALLNANYFLSIPPFNIYRNFFNIFAIEVVSTQSGIDHPGTAADEATYIAQPKGPIVSVNTALNCTFDYAGNYHRLVATGSSATVNSIATTNFPQYDWISVICNSAYYGGSGGGILYSTMHVAATEIFVHEFGHTFGLLQDEYTYGYAAPSCTAGSTQMVNVSQVKNGATVVWKNWLPTPLGTFPSDSTNGCGSVGIFEGGQYCATNWFRPKCYCKMRTLGFPFCEVCSEQLVYRMDTAINYIDNALPASSTLTVCRNSLQPFTASILNTTTNTVRAQWFVNGSLVTNNATAFNLNTTTYGVGTHTVKLVAQDTSTLARKRLAVYSRTWTVTVTNTAPVNASVTSNSVCAGSPINLTGSGATTYSWRYPNGTVTATQNPIINNAALADSGVYTLSGLGGTCLSTDTVIIKMKPLPVVTKGYNSPLYITDTLKLTSGGGTTYSWSGPNSFVSGLQNPKKANIAYPDSGYYRVTVTNNGCQRMDSIYVSVLMNSSLPVELISFNGKALDNFTTLLNWKTASEINNNYFEIQHSENSIQWKSIGKVKGNNSGNKINSYSYTHENPINGINYYRLKQVDNDGRYDYSKIIIINFNKASVNNEEPKFLLFPNPAKYEISIKTDQKDNLKNLDVQIYNLIGECLYKEQMKESQITLNLSDYKNGIYLIKVGSQSFKIIKE